MLSFNRAIGNRAEDTPTWVDPLKVEHIEETEQDGLLVAKLSGPGIRLTVADASRRVKREIEDEQLKARRDAAQLTRRDPLCGLSESNAEAHRQEFGIEPQKGYGVE